MFAGGCGCSTGRRLVVVAVLLLPRIELRLRLGFERSLRSANPASGFSTPKVFGELVASLVLPVRSCPRRRRLPLRREAGLHLLRQLLPPASSSARSSSPCACWRRPSASSRPAPHGRASPAPPADRACSTWTNSPRNTVEVDAPELADESCGPGAGPPAMTRNATSSWVLRSIFRDDGRPRSTRRGAAPSSSVGDAAEASQLPLVVGVDAREVELRHQVQDEVGEVTLRQPVLRRRRQEVGSGAACTGDKSSSRPRSRPDDEAEMPGCSKTRLRGGAGPFARAQGPGVRTEPSAGREPGRNLRDNLARRGRATARCRPRARLARTELPRPRAVGVARPANAARVPARARAKGPARPRGAARTTAWAARPSTTAPLRGASAQGERNLAGLLQHAPSASATLWRALPGFAPPPRRQSRARGGGPTPAKMPWAFFDRS